MCDCQVIYASMNESCKNHYHCLHVMFILYTCNNYITIEQQDFFHIVYVGIEVGYESTSYIITESLSSDFGLLVCVSVEDVRFPFVLRTTPQDVTTQGILL